MAGMQLVELTYHGGWLALQRIRGSVALALVLDLVKIGLLMAILKQLELLIVVLRALP